MEVGRGKGERAWEMSMWEMIALNVPVVFSGFF